MLGDNSPISGDARTWHEPVHLPAEMLDVEAGRVPGAVHARQGILRLLAGRLPPVLQDLGQDNPVLNPGIIPNFGDMRSIH